MALLLAVILFPDARRSHVARYLLGFYAGMASFYLAAVINEAQLPVPVRAVLFFIRVAGLYFLWKASAATFRDDYQPERSGPWICALSILSSLAAILLVNRTSLFEGVEPRLKTALAGIVPALWSLLFLWLTTRETLRGWSSDMVNSRRNFRVLLTSAVALSILLIIILRFSMSIADSRPWTLTSGLVLVFIFAGVFLRAGDDLLGRPTRRKYVTDESIARKLKAAMEEQLLYREEGLTIRELARRLDEPEYRLRLEVNNGLGFRNFNQFLNSYRIRDARRMLSDPDMQELTVLRISLDLGFGSISSFNKAFREITGMTPTQFRANGAP